MRVLLFLIFFPMSTLALDLQKHADSQKSINTSSIYIDYASEIKNLETVTYLISSVSLDRLYIDNFVHFSHSIGKNNGAVILASSEILSDNLKEDGIKSNLLIDFRDQSQCNFSPIDQTKIIFEDRTTKGEHRCFTFIVENLEWLADTLSSINLNINEIKENKAFTRIKEESLRNLLLHGVDLEKSGSKGNMIYEFVSYIADSLKNTK